MIVIEKPWHWTSKKDKLLKSVQGNHHVVPKYKAGVSEGRLESENPDVSNIV